MERLIEVARTGGPREVLQKLLRRRRVLHLTGIVTSNSKKPSLSLNPSPIRSLTLNQVFPFTVCATRAPVGEFGETNPPSPSASSPGTTPFPAGPLQPPASRNRGSQQTVPLALNMRPVTI